MPPTSNFTCNITTTTATNNNHNNNNNNFFNKTNYWANVEKIVNVLVLVNQNLQFYFVAFLFKHLLGFLTC